MEELSSRMQKPASAILPKIAATIAERTSARTSRKLDLSTAENWLIRPELVEIYKDAIQNQLTVAVCTSITPYFLIQMERVLILPTGSVILGRLWWRSKASGGPRCLLQQLLCPRLPGRAKSHFRDAWGEQLPRFDPLHHLRAG
jgi:hypothetical protein